MRRFVSTIALLLWASAAFAVEQPVQLPPWFPQGGYEVHDPKYRAWDQWTVIYLDHSPLPKNSSGYTPVSGRVWQFSLGDPKPEVWASIRARLEQAGFKVAHGDPSDKNPGMFAMQKGDGEHALYVSFWNHHNLALIESAPNPFQVTLAPPAARPEVLTPKADFPFLSPLPGSKFTSAHVDQDGLHVSVDCKGDLEVRGTATDVRAYDLPPNISDAAAQDAYLKALGAAGWDYVCPAGRWTYAHYTRNGRDLWAKVVTDAPRDYSISIADTGAGLRADLKKGCKAALYGVNFDFNKATLRADAEPALNQLLEVLKEQPKLAVEIGGHTDNVGKPDYNLKLSDQRAATVREWLAAHGIAAARLTSHGYGETQPLVPNSTDDDRAKNRRVVVKRLDCK